jgi:heat shock protein HslJ
MACMEPGVMEQEYLYLSLLSDVVSVTAGSDTLSFQDSRGTTILSFDRMVPHEPEPLVGTNWTLASLHTEDAVSSVISGTTITAVFDDEGRVAGSAGCNRYFGPYTLEGDSLSIGELGTTRMYCPGPGIMEQEAGYLDTLSKAAGFMIEGSRMSLVNANGRTLLTFTAES